MTYFVCIAGTLQARLRWPTRAYKLRSSARRRVRQIRQARDFGVSTIWTMVQ